MKKFVVIVSAVFIICLMICGIIIVSFGGAIFKENNNINFNNWPEILSIGNLETYTVNESKVSESDSYKTVKTSAVVADIEVIKWEEDTFKATFIGELSSRTGQPYLKMTEDEDTLTFEVKYPNQFKSISTFSSNLKVYLYVPNDYDESLSFHTVSGKIEVSDFAQTETVTLNSVSGTLTVMDMNGENLYLSSVSGNISLENIEYRNTTISTTSGKSSINGNPGNLDVNSVSGNVTADIFGQLHDISIDTVSGKANISIDSDQNAEVNMSSVSGNFDVNIPVSINNSSKTKMSFVIGSEPLADIDLSSVSGNLNIIVR